jgi:hypothetical protein
MTKYQTEFSDFPAADMPAIPQGFGDNSWHNDSCPCFISEELGLRIWVDYADKQQREIPDGARFALEPSDNEDNITEPVVSDDWSVILAAVEEERAEITACLAQLEKADGAILHWQLDDKKFAVMLKRGLIRMEGDLLVHPNARKVTELAFTMTPAAEGVRVLYISDNEPATVMWLESLIANFSASGGWQYRHNETDLRNELESRGGYEGLHDHGHYLVLAIDKMHLEPHPAHPRNEIER